MSVHGRGFVGLLDASARAASDKRRSDAVVTCYRNVTQYLQDILDSGGEDITELEVKVAGIAAELGLCLSRVREELPKRNGN